MVCIKTCYSSKPAKNPFHRPNTSHMTMTFQNCPWLMPQGKLIEKLPIFQEHFWAIIFYLDKNDINNFGPKGQPFKTILTWEEMLQLGRSSMAYIVARSRQIMKKRIKKLIVMSCTWRIRLILRKNQEAKKEMLRKWWKNCKNCKNTNNFFFCKELLFSLGNCVWNEKWPSFIILHL